MQVQDVHLKIQINCRKELYLFIKMINSNIKVCFKIIEFIHKLRIIMKLLVVLFHKIRNNRNQVFTKINQKILSLKLNKNKKQIIKASKFK